ncbi:hypothetical protein H0H87_008031 [Tephrocybe sp. NHM501043]|nr:hypothetical protein H0H87_008031 [Tephrocybe sp. NHM501043]
MLVTQPTEGVDTVFDVLRYAARVHGTHRALGWRDVVKIHEERKEITKTVNEMTLVETKTWKYFELSEYKYLSFVEFESMVVRTANALLDLGFTANHILNIYAQTSVNWQLMAHACSSISTVIATAYDTLGEAGLTHSLNEPGCFAIFTNTDLLNILLKILPNTPTVKYVFYDGDPSPCLLEALEKSHVQAISISTLLERGKYLKHSHILDSRRPTRDTLACIMYTSGSTGVPKGVCLTHGNLIASVGSVVHVFGHHLPPRGSYLAYLPLAHVLEYIVELCALYTGITSGYARPKTLTDASVRGCRGDLAAFRPNIMFGVPAVWETIRKGILGKVAQSGWVTQMAFKTALKLKKAGAPILGDVADSMVLSKIREATGGHLVFTMNGGAAISQDTQDFLSWTVAPMMQGEQALTAGSFFQRLTHRYLKGYGMTESCGMCTLLPPELPTTGRVGLPVPSVEIKLLDVPDAGYFSRDIPPRGEVCIRGPSVTKGYYKRPDLNNDENVFTKDGWLRTGDVGQWNDDGTLSIIDRIKNLVKLQSGEPIAIIIPHEANLRPFLDYSTRTQRLSDLCVDHKVRALIVEECNAVARNAGFRECEALAAVVLTPEEWTPESGLVTPAMKIQRARIGKFFEREIKSAYGN